MTNPIGNIINVYLVTIPKILFILFCLPETHNPSKTHINKSPLIWLPIQKSDLKYFISSINAKKAHQQITYYFAKYV